MAKAKTQIKEFEAEAESSATIEDSTNEVKDISKSPKSIKDITGGAKFDKDSTFEVLASFTTTLGEAGLVEATAGEKIKLSNLAPHLIEALVAQGYIKAI